MGMSVQITNLEAKENDYWLIILNVSISSEQDIKPLWNRANKIICLDGAINKLKKYFENDPISRGPDFVIGDFDSIDPQSIKWLEDTFGKCSYKLHKFKDQDTTDFDKSLKFILESTESVVENVVALNCFGGRLDHTLAILNSAQKFEKSSNLKIQLMNESCLARVIHDNEVIINYSNLQGNNCGLLPLFGPINLETVGLKWDLNSSQKLEFSDLISTSNCVIDSQVVIKSLSNIPFIWTHEITYQ